MVAAQDKFPGLQQHSGSESQDLGVVGGRSAVRRPLEDVGCILNQQVMRGQLGIVLCYDGVSHMTCFHY